MHSLFADAEWGEGKGERKGGRGEKQIDSYPLLPFLSVPIASSLYFQFLPSRLRAKGGGREGKRGEFPFLSLLQRTHGRKKERDPLTAYSASQHGRKRNGRNKGGGMPVSSSFLPSVFKTAQELGMRKFRPFSLPPSLSLPLAFLLYFFFLPPSPPLDYSN